MSDTGPAEDGAQDVEREPDGTRLAEPAPEELATLTVRERAELLAQERRFLAEERERRHAQRHRRLNTLAIMLGVIVGLGTMAGTAATLRATQHQLGIARDAQINDRYAKTIEALSSEDSSVRLGALHALGRLMEDSPRDLDAITAVLVAYLHQRTSRTGEEARAASGSDLEAAMVVLAGRPRPRPLSSLTLRDFFMSGIRLSGGDLSGAHLGNVDLSDADLSGVHLHQADLQETYLRDANLRGADLSHAYLREADLGAADLRGANLSGADLGGADLRGAALHGVNLRGADLSGSIELSGGADLRGAVLRASDLYGANLRGVDLRGTGLSKEQVRAFTDEIDGRTSFGALPEE